MLQVGQAGVGSPGGKDGDSRRAGGKLPEVEVEGPLSPEGEADRDTFIVEEMQPGLSVHTY